jgi:D-glycero-beta-D-manno-heptose-7-phosphate kinase
VSHTEQLISVLKRFPGRRVVVIGDAIADRFIYGGISRVSREAPVFIIRHEQTETVPGGAANCAVNLASLGAQVSLVAVVGNDEPGRALIAKLKTCGVSTDGIITSDSVETTTKVRILAGQAHSTRQQVIRIDYEADGAANADLRSHLLEHIEREAREADAIVVSDYNYGVVDEQTVNAVKKITATRNIPVLVDSRFQLLDFPGFTSATPNEAEVAQLVGEQNTTAEQLRLSGEELRTRLGYGALLITRGSQGMMLFEEGAAPLELDAIGAHQPVDVTGAGDTVIATYALALSSGASFADAARLANYAGGLVVMKRGTASVTAEELEHSILHS